MKGLLIKDLKLIKNQKSLFVAVGAFVLLFYAMGSNLGFVVGYVSFLCVTTVLGTISYDEFNNGNVFLFTMPFDRRTYAAEKYVLGIGVGTLAWLLASLATTGVLLLQNPQLPGGWALTCLVLWVMMGLVLAISLPLQLKFGAEKGRLALFVAYGFIVAAGLAVWYGGERLGIRGDQVAHSLGGLGAGGLVGIGFLTAAAGLALSYRISRRIMERKAF